jgi:hypothetical protein
VSADRAPRPVGLRERAGVALLRAATGLAADRRSTARRIAALPAGVPGRDRAMGTLAVAGWVDAVLLWLGWRLLPDRALAGRAAPPAP